MGYRIILFISIMLLVVPFSYATEGFDQDPTFEGNNTFLNSILASVVSIVALLVGIYFMIWFVKRRHSNPPEIINS
jgi:hypothetical protein